MFTAAYWSWCICDSHREWEAECQAVYPQGTQRYLLAWGLADACQKKASAQQISLGNAMHDVSKRQRSVVKKGRRCSSYWLTRAAFRIWFWSTYSNSILGDGSAFREGCIQEQPAAIGLCSSRDSGSMVQAAHSDRTGLMPNAELCHGSTDQKSCGLQDTTG